MPQRPGREQPILDAGLALASEVGLRGVTIGKLADAVDLSKAGLYAHFDSKEHLLAGILREAVERFVEDGLGPALQAPPGEPRLRALFEVWLEWTKAAPLPGGCVFISSAAELDDRPGALREELLEIQQRWARTLAWAVELAVEEGDLAEDVDPDQFVFELYAIVLSFHFYHRLFEDPEAEDRARSAFEELMRRAA